MPSGKIHAAWSLGLSVPTFVAGAAIGGVYAGAAAAGGCLLGILLSPDLDQESISTVEWKLVKYTGGIGYAWPAVWTFYALACKHRGMSHWPFVGTAGRLLYISAALLIAALLGYRCPAPPFWVAAWVIAGLLVSDICHWVLDIYFPDFGREHHRARKRHS